MPILSVERKTPSSKKVIGDPFRISVILPVRNESFQLLRHIEALRRTARFAPIEVIVVDGKSSDNTLRLAKAHADIAIESALANRAYQMHQGAKAASGDILLFLHADTQLSELWQYALIKAWRSKTKPTLTAFQLSFDNDSWYYRLMARMAEFRAHWLTGVPHGDQALAIDRNVYFSIGGFPTVPLMEEYFLIKKLKNRGSYTLIKDKVITSARRYEKNGVLYNNLRNLVIICLFYLGISPQKLAKIYK